ncbi:transmembrane protein 192 [Aplochiton taeniatus]
MDAKGTSVYAPSTSVDFNQSMEDDPLVDGPLISPNALHSAIRREFQTVPTSFLAVLLSILHVVYVALSVTLAVVCVLKFGKEEECVRLLGSVSGESVIVLGKVGLWLLVALFGVCVHHHHHQVRSRGYLRFYRDTRGLKQLPFIVHSSGNVALLVVLASKLSEPVHLYVLLGVLGLELLVALPLLVVYTVKVVRFNSERAGPDITQDENSHNFSHTALASETGFREGSHLEEVVEKQADLIEYLKQHNTLLSKRLLHLSAQH